MIQNEDGRFKMLVCVDFRKSCTETGKCSFYVRFRKRQSKTLREAARNFYGFILYFDSLKVIHSYIILEKTEDSVNLKTNHSVLRKQGRIFRD